MLFAWWINKYTQCFNHFLHNKWRARLIINSHCLIMLTLHAAAGGVGVRKAILVSRLLAPHSQRWPRTLLHYTFLSPLLNSSSFTLCLPVISVLVSRMPWPKPLQSLVNMERYRTRVITSRRRAYYCLPCVTHIWQKATLCSITSLHKPF